MNDEDFERHRQLDPKAISPNSNLLGMVSSISYSKSGRIYHVKVSNLSWAAFIAGASASGQGKSLDKANKHM